MAESPLPSSQKSNLYAAGNAGGSRGESRDAGGSRGESDRRDTPTMTDMPPVAVEK